MWSFSRSLLVSVTYLFIFLVNAIKIAALTYIRDVKGENVNQESGLAPFLSGKSKRLGFVLCQTFIIIPAVRVFRMATIVVLEGQFEGKFLETAEIFQIFWFAFDNEDSGL